MSVTEGSVAYSTLSNGSSHSYEPSVSSFPSPSTATAASSSSSPAIVEPTYSPAHVALLFQMRQIIAARTKGGLQPTPEFKAKLPITLHWRDLYHRYRHLTAVRVTPDPRPSASASAALPSWPDFHLHRFLKARGFQLQPATDLFLNATWFRQQFGMDDLAAQPVLPFSDFHQMFMPERLHHTDDRGCPLYLNFLGDCQPELVAAWYPAQLGFLIEAFLMEQGLRAQEASSAALGRRVTLLSVILQCAGVSLAHRSVLGHLNPVLWIDDVIFPENMRQLIIINAPTVFTVLWTIIGPLIDSQTRAKFVILPPASEAALIERIGVAHTPREIGGQCARCLSGCVPRKADWDETWRAIGRGRPSDVDAWEGDCREEVISLAARYNHVVQLEVRKRRPDGVAERVAVWWTCTLDAKDINFSLTFTSSSVAASPPYTLVAPTRHAASSGALRGCHYFTLVDRVDEGQATLTFSNSMSTFSGKAMRLKTGMRAIDSAETA